MSDDLFADDGIRTSHSTKGAGHGPGNFRDVLRNSSENLAIEILDDLRPPLFPPQVGGSYLRAVLQRQELWQTRERICRRLVVIRMIRRRFIAARARTQFANSELSHHVLMIF